MKDETLGASFFKGKVVIFYLINPPEAFVGGVAISDPILQELNGRAFIIGNVPSNPDDWTSDLRTGVAVDQVAHFVEFANEDDLNVRNTSVVKKKNLS